MTKNQNRKEKPRIAGFDTLSTPVEPSEKKEQPQQDSKGSPRKPSKPRSQEIDPIDAKMSETKFTASHKQRGLYIRTDLDKILTKESKKLGHGGKTLIVNEALERLFKEREWMEKDSDA